MKAPPLIEVELKRENGSYRAGVSICGRPWEWRTLKARKKERAELEAEAAIIALLLEAAGRMDAVAHDFAERAKRLRGASENAALLLKARSME